MVITEELKKRNALLWERTVSKTSLERVVCVGASNNYKYVVTAIDNQKEIRVAVICMEAETMAKVFLYLSSVEYKCQVECLDLSTLDQLFDNWEIEKKIPYFDAHSIDNDLVEYNLAIK